MNPDWMPFVDFVGRHQYFLLTTHTRPDGDALGCLMALAEALEARGKKVERIVPGRMPPRYQFMDSEKRIEAFEPPAGQHLTACDAIVVVDTGTWNQLAALADVIRNSSAEKFVIDHHRTQDELGGQRLVDTSAEACGRLVHDAIVALQVPLTATMAHYLYIAIATDTGWFRYSNTTPATHHTCGELLGAGARPTEAFERIYECNSPSRLKLLGLAIQRIQSQAAGQLAWTEVYLADYELTGAIPPDTEDLINFPRSIAGVEVALFFAEQREGSAKVSFRSQSRIDVAKLAEKFGGGGHQRAAGATVKGTMAEVRDRVLAATEQALRESPTRP